MTRDEKVAIAWQAGRLRWKLRPYQRPIYDDIRSSSARRFVLEIARRFGKTHILTLISIEEAIRTPGAQILFAAPTALMVRKIVLPIARAILADCPPELQPDFAQSDGALYFPNGAEFHLAGTDNGNGERLRGRSCHFGAVDEAGFASDLDYLVSSIMMPQTLTVGGRIVLASTPPPTPASEFDAIARRAESEGAYVKRTIFDNDSITPELRAEYAKEAGGEQSTTWRREYLCERITDETRAVVPEFTDERAGTIVVTPEVPPFYDPIVALDVGFEDLSVALFGYYDFVAAKLVVQDEVVLRRMTTEDLALAVKAKELELWKAKEVFGRWSDVDLILINDLGQLHKLYFVPTAKDDKEAQINQLRMWVAQGRLVISPKCVTLIRHLKTAIWNRQRTTYERTKDDGHFDAVDALVYMLRNAPVAKNPYPPEWTQLDQGSHHINMRKVTTMDHTERQVASLFGRRRS